MGPTDILIGGTPGYMGETVVLPSGRVLVAGGSSSEDYYASVSNATLYDPVAGRWMATGALAVPRRGHIIARLGNGKVLVAGGSTWGWQVTAGAELADEMAAGTNPLDRDSRLSLEGVTQPPVQGNAITFIFGTIPARIYFIQCADELGGAWTNLSGLIVASGCQTTYTAYFPDGTGH